MRSKTGFLRHFVGSKTGVLRRSVISKTGSCLNVVLQHVGLNCKRVGPRNTSQPRKKDQGSRRKYPCLSYIDVDDIVKTTKLLVECSWHICLFICKITKILMTFYDLDINLKIEHYFKLYIYSHK